MKTLDITKKYDLSELNDDQLQDVYNKTFKPIGDIKFNYLLFKEKQWTFTTNEKGKITNALELFEEETHLLTAQDFVNASKGLAQIGIGLKQISENLNTVSKIINDKNCLDSDIKELIEKGKQHGLKIVVTFEKL